MSPERTQASRWLSLAPWMLRRLIRLYSMSIYTHVYKEVYTHVYTHVHTHVRTHVYTHVYIHVHPCVNTIGMSEHMSIVLAFTNPLGLVVETSGRGHGIGPGRLRHWGG